MGDQHRFNAKAWLLWTAGGIDVDRQFAVFGAYGAITLLALSGVLLDRLRASSPAGRSLPAPGAGYGDRPVATPERAGAVGPADPDVALLRASRVRRCQPRAGPQDR